MKQTIDEVEYQYLIAKLASAELRIKEQDAEIRILKKQVNKNG